MRSSNWLALGVAAWAMATGASTSAGTNVRQDTEYLNRIKTAEEINPLGDTPFGENVSLYTGGLSFRQTDISYPGIGPTIVLSRSYEASGSPITFTNDRPMADWDLSIPRIETIVGGVGAGTQGLGYWLVGAQNTAARCTQFAMISDNAGFAGPWWHGYQLIAPDGTSQPLLMRTPENTLAPGGATSLYPAVTPGHWMLSCLSATANNAGGEAFLATAPDGTRYWFDYLSYGPQIELLIDADNANGLVADGPKKPGAPSIWNGLDSTRMKRRLARLFVTKVEDRFGNSLTYRYDGNQRLDQISASDGRLVSIAWRSDAPLVASITLQPGASNARTWRYEYTQPTNVTARMLTRVVQPDQTTWEISTAYASQYKVGSLNPNQYCGIRTYDVPASLDNVVAINMVHPSGLSGRFNLSVRARGRSFVPEICAVRQQGQPPQELVPTVYGTLALTSKVFQGPGMAPATWNYAYSPARGSLVGECAGGCPSTQWTEATDPVGGTVHYTFSNRWDATEGRLLETVAGVAQVGTSTPVGLQVDRSTFAPTDQGPFPSHVGYLLTDSIAVSNSEPTERMQLESLHETIRQGVTFSRRTTAFDRFGQPETVVRSSTLGFSASDTITYWPVTTPWVLGQVWKRSGSAGVEAQTQYDALVRPTATYSFGLPTGTIAYNADGTAASLTDPMGHVTSLGSYYRGVPQLIRFNDQSTIAPTADTFGQVTAVRNQLGDTTGYDYDVAGRLVKTSYPVNDSVAWQPTLRNFTRVNAIEYGLGNGHWTNVVSTGNGRATTYYDAMWRPVLVVTEDVSRPASKTFVVTRYDAAGRKRFTSYPVGALGSVDDVLDGQGVDYDALGRTRGGWQNSELGRLSTTIEYLDGFRTLARNARGYATTTSYQAFDAPTDEFPVRIEAPNNVLTLIDRDEWGKPRSITRSGPDR